MAKTIATEERKMKEMFSAEELAHIASIMEANPISPTDPEVNRTATKVSNTAQVGSSLNTNVVSSRDLTDETIREDFEYGMARNELATADRAIQRLMKHLKGEGEIEAWVQSKITKASDYLDTVADYMDGGKVNEEVLDEGRGRPPKQGSAAWHRQKGTTPDSSDSQESANQGRDPRQHIQVIAGQAAAGRQIDFKHNDGSTSKITPAMGRKITSHLNGLKPAERQGAVNKMHDSADGLKV